MPSQRPSSFYDGQGGGQAWRFDAEQVDEPGYAVRGRPRPEARSVYHEGDETTADLSDYTAARYGLYLTWKQ